MEQVLGCKIKVNFTILEIKLIVRRTISDDSRLDLQLAQDAEYVLQWNQFDNRASHER